MSGEQRSGAGGARIAIGTLVIGAADLVFAMGFWWLGYRVSPVRILQSIGAGWYGDASFQGGARTAMVGALSHFFIVALFILGYRLAARHMTGLRTHPTAAGLLYGVLLYLLMNFVVLPLSAAGMAKFNHLGWVLASILMHALIGVMCAHFALATSSGAGPRMVGGRV